MESKKFDSFGAAVRYVIKSRGLKQTKVASETGIHQSQISRYLKSRETPEVDNQEKLTDYLSVEISQEPDGRWLLSARPPSDRLEDLFTEYESRKASQPASKSERALLIEFLKVHAEATVKGVHLLARMENLDPE